MAPPPLQQIAATDPPDRSERQVWIDDARGIGVILVVFGHVLGGLYSAHLFEDEALVRWISYTLYTFHMPLFFFLAGLHVQHSLRRGPREFLAVKGWTIAYPYVLWSLIQGGIIMLASRDANIPIYPGDLLAIWYKPIAQFWFLYALMICHLLAAFIANRAVLIGLAAIGLVVFLLLPTRPDLALTLHHFPFYVIGILGAHVVTNWQPQPGKGSLWLAGVTLAFAIAVAVGGYISGTDANGAASLPACVFGIAAVVMLCKLLDSSRHHWLATVGVMSMTIYILHILAGSGARIVMLKLNVPHWPWLYLLACTAAGVILPMIAHVVLQKLNLLSALGLAPLARRKIKDESIAGSAVATERR